MAGEGVEIRLSTVGDAEVIKTFQSIQAQAEGFGRNLEGALSRTAFAVLGQFATLTGVLYAGVTAFKSLVMGGLETRDMLDKAQVSLAIVLESLYKYPGAASQHAAASRDAARQLEALKARSSEVLGSLESLVAANQRLVPAMAAAGVQSEKQATDFTVLIAKIGDVTGQSYEAVASQMLRMITTGRMARGEIAQTLRAMGVSDDTIRSWKALGTAADGQSVLITNLMERFKAYEASQKELLDTQAGMWRMGWKGLQGIVRDALADVDGELKGMAKRWRDYILANREDIRAALAQLFENAGKAIGPLIDFLLQLAKVFGPLISRFGVAAVEAYVLYKAVTTLGPALLKLIDNVATLASVLYEAKGTLTMTALQVGLVGAAFAAATYAVVNFWKAVEEGKAKQAEDQAWSVLQNSIDRLRDKAAEDPLGSKNLLKALQELSDAVVGRTAPYDVLLERMKKLGQAGNDAGLALQRLAEHPGDPTKLKELDDEIAKMQHTIDAFEVDGLSRKLLQIQAKADETVAALTKKMEQTTPPEEKKKYQIQIDQARDAAAAESAAVMREEEKARRTSLETRKKFQDEAAALWVTGYQKERLVAVQTYQEEMRASQDRVLAVGNDSITLTRVSAEEAVKRGLIEQKLATELANIDRKTNEERGRLLTGFDVERLRAEGEDYEAQYAEITQKLIEDQQRLWDQFGGPLGDPILWLAAIDAFNAKMAEVARQHAIETAGMSGDWTAFINNLVREVNKGRMTVTEFYQQLGDAQYRWAQSVDEGVVAAFNKLRGTVKSDGQLIADVITGLAESMQQTLSSGFFDIITGNLSDLTNVFKKFGEDILRMLSDYFAQIVMRWILTGKLIAQSPLQAGVAGGGGAGGGLLGFGGGQGSFGGGWTMGPNGVLMPQTSTGGGIPYMGGLGALGIIGGSFGSGNIGGGIGGLVGGAVATILGTGAAGVAGSFLGITGGATMGATLGTVVPIVGTIIGFILGSLIGALFKASTEIKVYGREFMPQIQMAAGNLQAGVLEVYAASGLKDVQGFSGGVNSIIAKYLARAGGFKVAAGSQADVDKDIQRLLSGIIPTELLHLLIGQQRTGGMDVAGIAGASTYGGQLDKSAPIYRMLEDLGFTAAEIDKLAKQIDMMKPEEWLKQLNALVGAVAGLNEAQKKLRRSYADIVTEQEAEEKRSPAEKFREGVDSLIQQAEIIGKMSGPEQVAKAQEWLQSVEQVIAAEEEAIRQLRAMAQGIRDQATAIRERAEAALRTPEEQRTFNWLEVHKAWKDLQAAATPDEVQKAWNRFSSNLSAVIDGLVARVQALRGLIDSIKQTVEAMTLTNIAADPNKNPFLWLAVNQQQIDKATTAFKNSVGDEQVKNAQKLYGLLVDRYNMEVQLLGRVKDAIQNINTSIDEQIFGIQQQGRTPQEQAEAIWQRIRGLYDKISLAKSPEEVTQLVSQIQQLGGQLLNLDNNPTTRAFIVKMLEDTRTEANRVLGQWQTSLEEDISDIGAQLDDLVKDLGDALTQAEAELNAALTAFDQGATYAAKKLDAFGDQLVTEVGRLEAAVTRVKNALTGLAEKLDDTSGKDTSKGPDEGGPQKVPLPKTAYSTSGGRTDGQPPGGATISLTLSVTVNSGTPEEVAAAVGDEISATVVPTIVTMLKQNNREMVRELRMRPDLLRPVA